MKFSNIKDQESIQQDLIEGNRKAREAGVQFGLKQNPNLPLLEGNSKEFWDKQRGCFDFQHNIGEFIKRVNDQQNPPKGLSEIIKEEKVQRAIVLEERILERRISDAIRDTYTGVGIEKIDFRRDIDQDGDYSFLYITVYYNRKGIGDNIVIPKKVEATRQMRNLVKKFSETVFPVVNFRPAH